MPAAAQEERLASSTVPLEIRLFGPFSVRVGGAALPRPLSRKAEWLLGMLVLRPGRAVSRAWLAETLWPETEPDRARFYLRRELNALRQALSAEAARLQAPSPPALLLAVDGASIDLLEFDAAIARASRGHPRGDEAALEQAVAVYRGELLEGCYEEWLLPEREQRRAAYLTALERLAALARQRDDPTTAALRLRQLTVADPLRESAHRDLMEALAEAGDHAAVLQVYRDLRLLLHRELHAAPAVETGAVYHRLRQAARPGPGRVWARAPRKGEAPRHNLPLLLTSFIGREREQAEVRELVAATRLVTLTGAGGCGKTRLALRVASDLVEQPRDGVWLADLSTLTDPELVLPAVARALGAREQAGEAIEATVRAFVRCRELLLVLDNCEHLPAACAALCAQLLAEAPGLRILATSRSPLGVTGEVAWRLPSLPTPDPATLPRDFLVEKGLAAVLADNPAVRLFCERARLVRPDFQLTPENAGAVAETCHALDGIPLAIELAAARLRGMPVTRLNELLGTALGSRFRLLVSDERTRPARQQTLHATMAWSFDLLSAPERDLLRALSTFSGGWTLEAAEAIADSPVADCGAQRVPGIGECSGPAESGIPGTLWAPQSAMDALDLLYQLVDRSLVVYEQREEEGRYRLLEMVREYAIHTVSPEAAARLRRRHAEYFLALAKEACAGFGGQEQGTWVTRLEAELGNFRLALRFWEAERGGEPLLWMTRGLYAFWKIRGYSGEGRRWMERAVDLPGDAPAELVAMCTRCAALLARDQGDNAAARALLERARAVAGAADERAILASTLNDLGTMAHDEGDFATAAWYYEQARTENAALGKRLCVAMNLANLGLAAGMVGDTQPATAYLEEAIAIAREERHAEVVPNFLANQAEVVRIGGDLERARALAESGLAMAREYGNHASELACLEVLARAAGERSDWRAAGDSLCQLLPLAERFGSPLTTASALECGAALWAAARPEDPRVAELATRLAAAGHAARQRIGCPLSPVERETQDRWLESARAFLGEDRSRDAWTVGGVATLDQAIAALKTLGFDLKRDA